jgi:hypothetical protein
LKRREVGAAKNLTEKSRKAQEIADFLFIAL